MIGIITALEAEMEIIRDNLTDEKTETISGIEYISGKIDNCDVVLAVCGIGKVFAAICTQTMILKYSPNIIINTGVAGSLSEKLSVGDICIAQDVVHHDLDTSPIGDPVGMVSGINMIYFPTSEDLVSMFSDITSELGFDYMVGTIASGDQFISTDEQKAYIKANFPASCCDMESASIGHVAYVNKIPFIIIRAISDNADGSSSMDYPTFSKVAAKESASIVLNFISKLNQ